MKTKMTDKKPILKRSTNPSVNTKNRIKYYVELINYYSDLAYQAKSKEGKEKALALRDDIQEKLRIKDENIMARKPKRKPLR